MRLLTFDAFADHIFTNELKLAVEPILIKVVDKGNGRTGRDRHHGRLRDFFDLLSRMYKLIMLEWHRCCRNIITPVKLHISSVYLLHLRL